MRPQELGVKQQLWFAQSDVWKLASRVSWWWRRLNTEILFIQLAKDKRKLLEVIIKPQHSWPIFQSSYSLLFGFFTSMKKPTSLINIYFWGGRHLHLQSSKICHCFGCLAQSFPQSFPFITVALNHNTWINSGWRLCCISLFLLAAKWCKTSQNYNFPISPKTSHFKW